MTDDKQTTCEFYDPETGTYNLKPLCEQHWPEGARGFENHKGRWRFYEDPENRREFWYNLSALFHYALRVSEAAVAWFALKLQGMDVDLAASVIDGDETKIAAARKALEVTGAAFMAWLSVYRDALTKIEEQKGSEQ